MAESCCCQQAVSHSPPKRLRKRFPRLLPEDEASLCSVFRSDFLTLASVDDSSAGIVERRRWVQVDLAVEGIVLFGPYGQYRIA
jgi:hypothetical protein